MSRFVLSRHVQAVMFDPLSYIHPERLTLPAAFGAPGQHAIINRMLLDHYQLSSDLPRVMPGSLDYLLLKHWLQLPQLAYLLACQRFRVALSRGGKLLSLPDWARSFAVLPLSHSGDDAMPAGGLDITTMLQQGLVDLLSRCHGVAPALRQRIPLLFPHIVKMAEFPPPAAAAERDDILLILALQHVKKFPGSTILPRVRKRTHPPCAIAENTPPSGADDRSKVPRAQTH